MVTSDRLTSIGASDSPKIICGPAFPVWAEKTGLAEPPDLDQIERVRWGKRLEASIVAGYGEDSGRWVEHNLGAAVTRHPTHPFLTATLDAIQRDDTGEDAQNKGIGALEVKNVDTFMAKGWVDDPPLKFQVQLQHQLAVTGLKWGTLAALIGGNRLEWFDRDRDDKFIEAMIAKLAFFWTQVLNKTPPEPDGSIATAECLKRLYPAHQGLEKLLPSDAIKWDDQLVAAKESMKTAKALEQEAHNHIAAHMGLATLGRLPGGGCYTFDSQDRTGYTVQPTTFRVLRRKSQ